MLHTLDILGQATPDAMTLVSLVKPVFTALFFGGWAWVAGQLDRDANYYLIQRQMWAGVHIAAGALGLLVLLLLPIYIIGLLLMLLIQCGAIVAYVQVRNGKVPEENRWTVDYHTWKVQREAKQRDKMQRTSEVKLIDKDGQMLDFPVGEDPYAKALSCSTKL